MIVRGFRTHYLPMISGFCGLLLFNGSLAAQTGGGLLLRSPPPPLSSAVARGLPKKENQLSIAIYFDDGGNVREAHVAQSSGSAAADELVQELDSGEMEGPT